MAKPQSKPDYDFSNLLIHTEFAEGGGFGPTSFVGYPVAAAYTIHRFEPKEGFKDDADAAYSLYLYLKFHVDQVLDDGGTGWDPDANDGKFDDYIKLGRSALKYFYPTNDGKTPAGIDKDGDAVTLDYIDGLIKGRGDNGAVVAFDGDPSSLHGRWVSARPGTPDTRRKIEPKSSYSMSLVASAPAVEAVEPGIVHTHAPNKKGEVTKILDPAVIAPDGLPYGSDLFLGMKGTWDTGKSPYSFTDKRTGKAVEGEQKYRYISNYDGRVDVETGEPIENVGGGGKKKQTGVENGELRVTPSTKKKNAPEPSADDDSDSPEERVLRVMLATAPDKGSTKREVLKKMVVGDSKEFALKEIPAFMKVYDKVVRDFPSKEDAALAAEMGAAPLFTYDPEKDTVDRWFAQE